MSDPPAGVPLDKTIAPDAAGNAVGAAPAAAADTAPRTPDSPNPAHPSPSFAPGELLADRYRINAFIARAGRGEVYRAHDL